MHPVQSVAELCVRHDGLPCNEQAVSALLARRSCSLTAFYLCTQPAWRLLTAEFVSSFERLLLLASGSERAPGLRMGVVWGGLPWPAAGAMMPTASEPKYLQVFAAGAATTPGWTECASRALAGCVRCDELFLAADVIMQNARTCSDAMADFEAVLDSLPAGLRASVVRLSLVKLPNSSQRGVLRSASDVLRRALRRSERGFVLEVSARPDRTVFDALMDSALFLAGCELGALRSVDVEVHVRAQEVRLEDQNYRELFEATLRGLVLSSEVRFVLYTSGQELII